MRPKREIPSARVPVATACDLCQCFSLMHVPKMAPNKARLDARLLCGARDVVLYSLDEPMTGAEKQTNTSNFNDEQF